MTSIAAPRAKRRDRKDTKAKLLKAALDVFSKNGFDAATTRHIAKKAGVNESLIHRYFESKLGLFLALKKQFRENIVKQFLAYEESGNLEEELIKFIKSRCHYSAREKKFFKLAISRAIIDPKSREDVQSYASMKPQALIDRFDRFRKRGKIREDVNLDQVVSILHAIAFSFALLMDAIECLEMEEADQLIALSAKILTKGLKP